MRMFSGLGRVVLTLAIVFIPLTGGALAAPSLVAACHGNGVSRSCGGGSVRLEAVSYGEGTYAWIYTEAWYHENYNFFLYGDNTEIDASSCVHGIWEDGFAINYQVQGAHRFNHSGLPAYSIGGSFTDGQCFPSESGGC